jgi:hypothetical protein
MFVMRVCVMQGAGPVEAAVACLLCVFVMRICYAYLACRVLGLLKRLWHVCYACLLCVFVMHICYACLLCMFVMQGAGPVEATVACLLCVFVMHVCYAC